MIPKKFILRKGIDKNKYIYHDRQVHKTNYYYIKTYPLPRVIHDLENNIYMLRGTRQVKCTDFKISYTTMILVEGYWRDCYPDDDTMRYFLSFPEKRNPYCNQNPHSIMIQYLIDHPQEIVWYIFSANSHPNAIQYLLNHTYMIDWISFCKNPSLDAIHYLLEHPEHIDWISFSQHPYLFEEVDDVDMYNQYSNMLMYLE
jgi:hypothetical protein